MAIPSKDRILHPCLVVVGRGRIANKDCARELAQVFNLTDAELKEISSSGVPRFKDRVDWALLDLRMAGLVERPARGNYQISELGRKVLLGSETELTSADLKKFRSLEADPRDCEDLQPSLSKTVSVEATQFLEAATPREAIENAARTLQDALAEDVLSTVLELTPTRFERLILDLLRAMGYGGGLDDMYRMTATTGDGGIDGVINEDALGLDALYIQAKRYAPENKIGREAVQAFVGSLTGEGATKGVFVTTSDFSRPARDYIERVQHRIVLINGERLARLMIAHDVGVRAAQTYVVKEIDENYFPDD